MNTSLAYDNNTLLDTNRVNVTAFSQWELEIWYWRVALYGIGGVFFACAGIVCNIISIIVLLHFRNNSSAPFLLICLAVFDSVYLLSILVLELLPILEYGQIFDCGYRKFLMPVYIVLYPVPLLAQTWVTYLVVVITIERFMVVAWPFLAYRLCSTKSVRIAVATIVILSILYHIPDYRAFDVQTIWKNKTQSWTKVIGRNEFGRSNMYTQVYEKWMNLIVNFVIPFTILLTFNVSMVRVLRTNKAEISAKRSQAYSREEQRLTLMVFCMTSIFFVCMLLAALCKIVLASYSSYHQLSIAANRFSAVADTILIVNSAINFAIYCVTGRKFRQTFVQVFCNCRDKTKVRTAVYVTPGKTTYNIFQSRLSSSSSSGSKPRSSTTETSLSSISNGIRHSKFMLSSDSIHNKLVVRASE